MPIVERIHTLSLPSGRFVVIGSGVLDALGLREAHGIDLVVTSEYFDELKRTDGWTLAQKHGEEVLTKDDLEVWLSWGSTDGRPNFRELYDAGITVGGIRFANPQFVRAWKVAHNRLKDEQDIRLLDEYLAWQKTA